jgi:hypothetical protein
MDLLAAVQNPIVQGVLAIAVILNIELIFRTIDEIILGINKILNLVPIPPIKGYFEGMLIKRLEKRIARYKVLIEKIKD